MLTRHLCIFTDISHMRRSKMMGLWIQLRLQAEPCRHMSATMVWQRWRHWVLFGLSSSTGPTCMATAVQSSRTMKHYTLWWTLLIPRRSWQGEGWPYRSLSCRSNRPGRHNANADALSRFPLVDSPTKHRGSCYWCQWSCKEQGARSHCG